MIVLVLNCGSSSLKFAALAVGDGAPRRLAGGSVAPLGERAVLTLEREGEAPRRLARAVPDYTAAVEEALHWVAGAVGSARVAAVGHRVVHGGARFRESVVLDDAAIAALEALETLAPLHNGPSVAGIRAARKALGPRLPMVAAFDTAFHATIPEHAARYAIPHDLAERHGIRRYGFHGLAFRSVVDAYARHAGRRDAALVGLHLGAGCSAAAIRGRRSLDTSMGLTPLEGLVMATRSGDLDPGLIRYLAEREATTCDEVERWLNHRSGLLGLSGLSADMRELLAREADDPRARLAVDVYCYRARKYVGAYLAALGGAEAVVFSGGVGEHAPAVRARITEGLEVFGLRLDATRNEAAVGQAARISADGAGLAAWVIPADEARVIAEETAACLGRSR